MPFELIKPDTRIDFVKQAKYAVATSTLIVVAAIAAMFVHEPAIRMGIDFTGGMEMQLKFAEVRTLGSYEGVLRQAILKIKHAAHEPLAVALGQRLAEQIASRPLLEKPDLVAAVPMHWLKRIWRGTHTAQTLSASVARTLALASFSRYPSNARDDARACLNT